MFKNTFQKQDTTVGRLDLDESWNLCRQEEWNMENIYLEWVFCI